MTEKATKEYFLNRVAEYRKKTGMSENTLARMAINKEGTRTFFDRVRDDSASIASINLVDAFMHRNPNGPKSL